MGYFLSKVLGTLMTPGMVLLLGMALGIVLLWSRNWRRGRAVLTLLGVLYAALALLPLGGVTLGVLENRFPANPAIPPRVNGIIVLGGAIDSRASQTHGQVELNDAGERVLMGVALARAYPEARVVLSGGAADPFRPVPKEAPMMAELFTALGVEPARLVVEDQSRNTYENAVFSQRLAQPGRGETWVLVTSARHMPRAVGCFRAIGWPVIPYPVDYETHGGPDWVNGDLPMRHLTRLAKAIHEWVGLLFYRLTGWTDTLFPGP